jgi:hypothetical protein
MEQQLAAISKFANKVLVLLQNQGLLLGLSRSRADADNLAFRSSVEAKIDDNRSSRGKMPSRKALRNTLRNTGY